MWVGLYYLCWGLHLGTWSVLAQSPASWLEVQCGLWYYPPPAPVDLDLDVNTHEL